LKHPSKYAKQEKNENLSSFMKEDKEAEDNSSLKKLEKMIGN
jgi:hypothetical protein